MLYLAAAKTRARRAVDTRVFELATAVAIAVSTVAFAVGTLPNLPSAARDYLDAVEAASVALFTLEYALRLLAAPKARRYVFSFWGAIDLAAVLPFYLSIAADGRFLRALRLLRLVRALKLARYNEALTVWGKAAKSIREEIVVLASVAAVLIFVSAAGVWWFEHQSQPDEFASVFHGLWWSVVTLTTVGYGDVYPVTLGGRLFTVLVLVLGVGVVAATTGVFASALTRVRAEKRAESSPDASKQPDSPNRAT